MLLFDNEEVKSDVDIRSTQEWDGFVEMRKVMKKPLTKRAADMAVTKLEALAPGDMDTQKAILSQSTFYCWLGLYPLDNRIGSKGTSRQAQSSYDLEELERMIRETPIFD